MSLFNGLFTGLSAFPITPADESGRIDHKGLESLLARLDAAKVDSIGLLGSTGTYAYLRREERLRAVEIAAKAVKTPLIVGVGALRTDDAIAHARDAEAAGAAGLLLAPVSYTPLTEEEVYRHFAAVTQATGLPLCIYNNPATTHFSFTPALIARLAEIDRIVAVKNPGLPAAEIGAAFEALRTQVPRDFAIGYSADWFAADALLAGAAAWYSVVAGLLPEPALRLTRAAQAGDGATAKRINASFGPLWALFKEFGSIRVMYAGARILALAEAEPPRPILPMPQEAEGRLREALAALG